MDIKAYIASGVIESYVMDMLPASERREFEALCREYPELLKARNDFEIELEQHAFDHAIEPPAFIKERVLSLVGFGHKTSQQILLNRPRQVRRISGMQWAVAASVLLLLGCFSFIYFMHQKSRQLKQEIVQSQEALDALDAKKKLLEESNPENGPVIKQVNVVLPGEAVPAEIKVYWDSTSTDVYLVIRNLPELKNGEKYQLWSITKGKHQSMGIFDSPKQDKLILRMQSGKDAESFAITIVKPN